MLTFHSKLAKKTHYSCNLYEGEKMYQSIISFGSAILNYVCSEKAIVKVICILFPKYMNKYYN